MSRFAGALNTASGRLPGGVMSAGRPRGVPESDALVELFLVPASTGAETTRLDAGGPAGAEARPVGAEPAPAPAPGPAPSPAALGMRPPVLMECLAGISAMQVRCPYAPEVELGFDAAGFVHAAAWAGRGGGPAAVGEVLTAAQWAREHAAILSNFTGGPARAEAMAHLLTDDAGSVRWLGGAGLRLHLAVRAGPAWAAAEL